MALKKKMMGKKWEHFVHGIFVQRLRYSQVPLVNFFGGVHGPQKELTAGYPKNDDLESMYLRLLEYGLFFRIHDFRDYTSL